MDQNEWNELLLSKQIDDVDLISSQGSQHLVHVSMNQTNQSIFNELQTNERLDAKQFPLEKLTHVEINSSKTFKNITKKVNKLKKKVKRAFISKNNITKMNVANQAEGKSKEIDTFTQYDVILDHHQNKMSNCQPHRLTYKYKRTNKLRKQNMNLSDNLNFGPELKDSKEHKNLNENLKLQNKPNSNSDLDASQTEKFISYHSTETYITEDLELSDQKYFQQKQYYMYNLVGHFEGQLEDTFQSQMYIRHFLQIYENLQKSKNIKISLTFSKSQKIKALSKKQKTLVIDLDETLVHCNEYPQLKSDFYIPVQINNITYQAGISVRPYAQEFLRSMAEYYEIIIFTASNEDYANQIIDYLDPTGTLVSGRLFREDCIRVESGCHVKDLRILNRDLKDVVLIDNSAFSYAFQIDNGIPIIPYLDNKKDNVNLLILSEQELQHLESYLKTLIQYDDFRKVNNKLFNLEAIQNCNSIQQAIRCITSNSNSQNLWIIA
ncbi:unnamed protein product (macronuclear) [Paramecium tetraurelia]|uniref:FCP1 homology domain-containing protein n=1 Tax=Paramecium tetraurelia TaxID=5888 RepID=A0E2M8_PARTE|nr:uncharacterized protein GSPATT00022717001 [Paramecium tetraurelia]CAK89545.1 unnamed protein product [Paramecium tetraurelia]|eukprot:XP_001456942.1 hypothetical protein (macronuclear) [Paramecium tetraurelia strain d4-2]